METRGAAIIVFFIFLSSPTFSAQAQVQLLGKTIIVSYDARTPAKEEESGRILNAHGTIKNLIYVSSLGRIFER